MRCRPGVERVRGRGWIRPVSARNGGAVSEYERQYEDGSDPQVLDIIDIPVLESQPADYQTENWLLDSEHYWERVDRLRPADLPALADPIAPLWVDGHHTYNGRNDKIPMAVVGSVAASLRLTAAAHGVHPG